MMGLVKFFQKRPTDKTILVGRALFGVLYVWVMYYNLIVLGKGIDTEYFFGNVVLAEANIEMVKYGMISIGFVPVIMWASNICIDKKKYVRIIQIIFWILLFYIASSLTESPNLDYDVLIWFMWILPLFAGITGKCITKKCLKYKEPITKIRV